MLPRLSTLDLGASQHAQEGKHGTMYTPGPDERTIAVRNAPITRHQSVVTELRDAILTGRIAPGERLLQVELAERLGVSRIPLREALRTLHGEGLVVIEPNRGTICRPLEAKDLADLYAVRLALEGLAVRAAAERYLDLRQDVRAMRGEALLASRRGDLARLIELDRAFHAELAERSGNVHLAGALDACWSQIMRGMHVYFTFQAYPENVWAEHGAIARAIALGDAERAAALTGEHIGHSRDAILRGLRGMSA
jgi:DNA-binding GntR family transcriptional regulator